ncbi:unnamed protein product [Clonostachys chloroleuca]|uniref:Uncharacterized protein n=1 Tax=Clonostachys chloroleuca TaxID=1926264 RepID=A0AA35Q1E9_9HYPO|nr:unnamed protein product [Clonostachys chloroleuca]
MELGIDHVSSVGGDKGRTAIWVPSGAASRGCLRPVSGQNGTDRFFKTSSTPEECKVYNPSQNSLNGRSRGIIISCWGVAFQKDQS